MLNLVVLPPGAVSDCRVASSTYKDPAFEQKLVTLARSQTFDPAPGTTPRELTLSWGKPPAAPGQ